MPSHKLLNLAYQVASRLSLDADSPLAASGFQSTLAMLLKRLASEHPHHVLIYLFALRAGGKGAPGGDVQKAQAADALIRVRLRPYRGCPFRG